MIFRLTGSMTDETAPQSTGTTPSRRWTVGVDGSECSRHAALWAAAYAPGRASEIQLASSWSVPVSTGMTPIGALTPSSTIADLETATRAIVTDLADHIAPLLDVPVTTAIGHGGGAALLLEAAHHSALLVVGSRGRGGFARLLLGSTSTQCATHSSAPVAVIPITAEIVPITSIVVAFDGSANSTDALQWAVTFASPGTTIDCVSVWDTTPLAVGSEQFFFPEAHDLARERFDALALDAAARCGRDDIEVRNHFVEGTPRAVLSERTKHAGLVVMGARGHGAIGSALLGSVSTWMLHHTNRPMVVVPHSDHDDQVSGDEV